MPGTAYKVCKICGEAKERGSFYKNDRSADGLHYHCKSCSKSAAKEWRRKNPEKNAARKRRWLEANPEKAAAMRRRTRGRRRAKERKVREDWKARNPQKARAQKVVANAVYYGSLVKPERCEDCGKKIPKAGLHGHHEDYSKPREVAWVCDPCHKKRHRT